MKEKKGLIFVIIVLALTVLAFAGYHIYRYPAMFRNLSHESLSEEQTESPKEEILSKPDKKIQIACFSYEVQELYAERDENQIYGRIYIPKAADEKMPTVIFSHGFGGNYTVGEPYAEALAGRGYVVYCFDFCGGSQGSRSDGSTLEMSIFTEQADLEAVLLYPAFVLVDHVKERFASVEEIPDTYYQMWMTVGRAYAEKLLDYDIYEAISPYDRDVLLIHGDADSIVPLSYSEKALEIYSSARLEVLAGAGHGFYGNDREQAIAWTLEYLDKHKNS